MSDKRSTIIEKIAKLKAMTNPDANAFQGEISNAAAKVQELMDKYSITEDEVMGAAVEASQREMRESFEAKSSEYSIHGIKQWHWSLAVTISKITHTKYFASEGYHRVHTMKFFGAETNAEIAASLYAEWVVAIETMADKATDDYWKVVMQKYDYAGHLKEIHEYGKDAVGKFQDRIPFEERTTYFKSSWLMGCVKAMAVAAREEEKRRTVETTNAIMVYQGQVEVYYASYAIALGMRSRGVAKQRVSSNIGYEMGYRVGSSIKLGSKKLK